jgi:hypothetical protein
MVSCAFDEAEKEKNKMKKMLLRMITGLHF